MAQQIPTLKKNENMVVCPDPACGQEFDLDKADGICPHCGLNAAAVFDRYRHERALENLRNQAAEEEKQKKDKDKAKPKWQF